MEIYLASKSPRRKELLERMGLEFTVRAVNTNETMDPFRHPSDEVARVSLEKAKAVQLIRWFHLHGDDAVYGQERRGDTDFLVTSGISDWAILFKTGCRSEYVIIEIQGT